jgi:hypothetical protein
MMAVKKRETAKERKLRSDAGSKRVVYKNPPHMVSFQLITDDPIEGAISKGLKKDLEIAKKTNPRATIKTIMVTWLSDYLDLNKE